MLDFGIFEVLDGGCMVGGGDGSGKRMPGYEGYVDKVGKWIV